MIPSENYTVCLIIDDAQTFEHHPFLLLNNLCSQQQVNFHPWVTHTKTDSKNFNDITFLSHLADNHGDLWLAYSRLWQYSNGKLSAFYQILHYTEYWHAVLKLWKQQTRNETFCFFIHNLKKIHDGIRKILSEAPPEADIYHSWGGSLELFRALQGANKNEKPLVISLTGNIEDSPRTFEKLLTREAALYTTYIWTDSETTTQYLKNIGVHPEIIRSTPWGLAKPLQSRERVFQVLPSNRVFTIGILGPFTPQRDIKTIFIALGLLKISISDIVILLFDAEKRHDSYWDDCQLLAESLGIANDMILMDSSKVSTKEIDILIIPNLDNPGESPIRLAFELGIITVLPEIESNTELLHHNPAFLYTPFDPENLFKRIQHIYQNEEDIQLWFSRFLQELILDTQPENQLLEFTGKYSRILTTSHEGNPYPKKTIHPTRFEFLKLKWKQIQPYLSMLLLGIALVLHSHSITSLEVASGFGLTSLSFIIIWKMWIRPKEKSLSALLSRFRLSLQRGTPEEWLVDRYSMEVKKLIFGLIYSLFFVSLPVLNTMWYMFFMRGNLEIGAMMYTTIGASIATGSFGIGLWIHNHKMLGKAVSIQLNLPGMISFGITIIIAIGEIHFYEEVLGVGFLTGGIVFLGAIISNLIKRFKQTERYLVSLACK